jgi:uncharacterized protein with HEPN domain
MVHDCLSIDLEEVWDIVARDVPFLRRQLEEIVPAAGRDGPD